MLLLVGVVSRKGWRDGDGAIQLSAGFLPFSCDSLFLLKQSLPLDGHHTQCKRREQLELPERARVTSWPEGRKKGETLETPLSFNVAVYCVLCIVCCVHAAPRQRLLYTLHTSVRNINTSIKSIDSSIVTSHRYNLLPSLGISRSRHIHSYYDYCLAAVFPPFQECVIKLQSRRWARSSL